LPRRVREEHGAGMTHLHRSRWRKILTVAAFGLVAVGCWAAEPTTAASAIFNSYTNAVEKRLRQQRRLQGSPQELVLLGAGVLGAEAEARLRRGELIVEQASIGMGRAMSGAMSGAMLHHWRGTAFVAGAKAEDFNGLMKDFAAYPRYYAPQVMEASLLSRDGDRFRARMRVRQRHVLTVVMDTTYDIAFGEEDRRHGYSESRSTEICEIDAAGQRLSGKEAHGYLWRLNSYWSYAERDGGLYIQIESVSLTRDIPRGLGWVVGPFVQSIPRESLEFTLQRTREGLRKR
jgi:hypothetical protein